MKKPILFLFLLLSIHLDAQVFVTRHGVVYHHECMPEPSNLEGNIQSIVSKRQYNTLIIYNKMNPYLSEKTSYYSKKGLLDSVNTISRSIRYESGQHRDTIIEGKEHYKYDDQDRVTSSNCFGASDCFYFGYTNHQITCIQLFKDSQDLVKGRKIYTDTLYQGIYGLDSIHGKWNTYFIRNKNGIIIAIRASVELSSNINSIQWNIKYRGQKIRQVIIDYANGDKDLEKYNSKGDLISEKRWYFSKKQEKDMLIYHRKIHYKYDPCKNWIYKKQSLLQIGGNGIEKKDWELNFSESRNIHYFQN
nr:hypothetical protein [uncultured Fluviicola sp.]